MNIEELKRLALAATPGPWRYDIRLIKHRHDGNHEDFVISQDFIDGQLKWNYPVICLAKGIGTEDSGPVNFVHMRKEDADFVISANPAAVLELIAEVEALRAEVKTEQALSFRNQVASLEQQRDELLAALKEARMFIRNGIELGFIAMPDADTPDPAHDTLPNIEAAIARVEG